MYGIARDIVRAGRTGFFTCLLALSTTALSAPVCAVDETSIDLGVWPDFMPIRATFAIENTGDENLTMTVTDKSCGCILVSEENLTIAPGAVTFLEFRTPQDKMKDHISASFDTNDTEHPTVILDVYADLVHDVKCTPDQLNLGIVAPREKLQTFVDMIRVPPYTGFSVTGVHSRLTAAELVKVEDVDRGRKRVYIALVIPESMPNFSDRLTVTTDSVIAGSFEVPVRAVIGYPLKPEPGYVLLDGSTHGGAGEVAVNLRGRCEPGALKAVSSDPRVSASLMARDNPRGDARAVLLLRFAAEPSSSGRIRAKVKVLDDSGRLLCLVTVLGRLPAGGSPGPEREIAENK